MKKFHIRLGRDLAISVLALVLLLSFMAASAVA